MFDVLLKYSSSPHHSFLCKTQYPSFQNSDFGEISQHCNRKIILTFFFPGDFAIVMADVFTYYRVFLSFPGPQGTVKHGWTPIVCYWANGKPFLSVVIFKIPKQYFIIKPPACWGADVSIEIYELLLLFSIITPWYELWFHSLKEFQ